MTRQTETDDEGTNRDSFCRRDLGRNLLVKVYNCLRGLLVDELVNWEIRMKVG